MIYHIYLFIYDLSYFELSFVGKKESPCLFVSRLVQMFCKQNLRNKTSVPVCYRCNKTWVRVRVHMN